MQLPRATRLVVRIAGPKSRAANARGGSPVRLPCRCPRLDSGEIYQRAIKRSRLVVMENCGQMPEMGEAGGVREAGRGFLGRLTLESRLTGLRRAFHRPEQSSEFMRYLGSGCGNRPVRASPSPPITTGCEPRPAVGASRAGGAKRASPIPQVSVGQRVG